MARAIAHDCRRTAVVVRIPSDDSRKTSVSGVGRAAGNADTDRTPTRQVMRSIGSFRRLVFHGLAFTDTTGIGTAMLPLRRVTLPAPTDVSPRAQRPAPSATSHFTRRPRTESRPAPADLVAWPSRSPSSPSWRRSPRSRPWRSRRSRWSATPANRPASDTRPVFRVRSTTRSSSRPGRTRGLHADESRVPVERRPKPQVQRTVVRGQ